MGVTDEKSIRSVLTIVKVNNELERVADVAGTPVIGRKELCAVAYQGRAACFDATNCNALWSRDFSSSVGMDRDSRFVVITDGRFGGRGKNELR